MINPGNPLVHAEPVEPHPVHARRPAPARPTPATSPGLSTATPKNMSYSLNQRITRCLHAATPAHPLTARAASSSPHGAAARTLGR